MHKVTWVVVLLLFSSLVAAQVAVQEEPSSAMENEKLAIERAIQFTEDESPTDGSRYQRLKELEWMLGDWVDQAGDDTIRIECKWTRNRNYISRAYTVNIEGQIDSSGLQVIGWDPKQAHIRSWLFDSNGGFVEGTWTKKGDRWFVQSAATLADGSAGSFTSIFRPLDQDSYRWKKVHRVVDGEVLPNIDEVVVTRQ